MDDDDDDDFAGLLNDFNLLDDEDQFDRSDGAFLDSISNNLREAAGLERKAAETSWQAPAAPGLDNSGLAEEEAAASAKRREVAETVQAADAALWDDLASHSPTRAMIELKPSFPNTVHLQRQPSGQLHVTTSDNLLAALEAEAKRLAASMSKENAETAAGAFDTLAAHARAAPRLDKAPLQSVLNDVAATGEEGQGLLRLVVSRRQGLSPDGKSR